MANYDKIVMVYIVLCLRFSLKKLCIVASSQGSKEIKKTTFTPTNDYSAKRQLKFF